MSTFAELLSAHLRRSGMSDAELARRLGVSRQTIFRWREGMVQRPRHREDVIQLAARLRLSPQERDPLLLAGGFAPEQPDLSPAMQQAPPAASPPLLLPPFPGQTLSDQPVGRTVSGESKRRRLRAIFIVATILLVLAVLAGGRLWQRNRLSEPRPAAPGETLVLIGQFVNAGSPQVGYNVAGRLQEAIQTEMQQIGWEEVRVEQHPATFAQTAEARAKARQLGATVLVWGEYDSGRAVAHLTTPLTDEDDLELQRLAAGPDDLNATINTDLPQDVRWLALYVLGRAYLQASRNDDAETALNRALADPSARPDLLAGTEFLLGVLAMRKPNADLTEAIAHYSRALDMQPGLVSALNNRGAAYFQRGLAGDLERAEKDLRAAVALAPDFAPAYLNLALTLARLHPDDPNEVLSLLAQAETLDPSSPGVQNILCWQLSLAGKPAEAMPHCDRAVALDPSGMSNDSRGLALALLGRHDEAAAEFERFLAALRAVDPDSYDHFAPTRQAWITDLRAGQNPFDAATLRLLRRE